MADHQPSPALAETKDPPATASPPQGTTASPPSGLVNVAFAGLTAAGKTTHARLLAEQLGYHYISATDVLLEIIGIDAPSEKIWFDHYDEIQAARQGDAVDEELDRRLAALAADSTATVFDTWTLAWVGPSPMIRIWIESDQESRARKCLVSHSTGRLSLDECRNLVRAKDEHTRNEFLRRHGFDLFSDRCRYDLILRNSHLIAYATRTCADAGIKAFAPLVRDAVTALLRRSPASELANLEGRYPQELLRIRPWRP